MSLARSMRWPIPMRGEFLEDSKSAGFRASHSPLYIPPWCPNLSFVSLFVRLTILSFLSFRFCGGQRDGTASENNISVCARRGPTIDAESLHICPGCMQLFHHATSPPPVGIEAQPVSRLSMASPPVSRWLVVST